MAIKSQAKHLQVATEMRRAITRGRWAPGSRIPTEDQLCEKYGVSRPTVRLAVQALRTEGLLDVQQGRGTFVRIPRETAPRTTIDRAVTRVSAAYDTGSGEWTDVEAPCVSHVRIDQTAASLLDTDPGEAAFLVERLLTDGTARVRQTILIPMEHATGTPLATPRHTTAAQAYTALSAAHGKLEWHDTVSARMPNPDERIALQAADIAPLLITQRITRTQADQRPLMLETITMPAETTQVGYTVRPTRPATRAGVA
jgi:GntR family transcriptional regulator